MLYHPLIKSIHFEITNQCNAACPMCSRMTGQGSVKPDLQPAEWDLPALIAALPPMLVRNLHKFYMCGNYGDPVVGRDTLPVFHYLRSHNPDLILDMHTNGSARTPSWWVDLARVLRGDRGGAKHTVNFALDGLADTHALYRRNTRYERIIANAEAFIRAGGNAVWVFIAFRHNEHQIQEAQDLAKAMGFARFLLKSSSRFGSKGAVPVYDRKGEMEYYLEPPAQDFFQKEECAQLERIAENYPGGLAEYYANTQISCSSQRSASLYISANKLVMPCCYTGGFHSGDKALFRLVDQHGGFDAIDLGRRTLAEIVTGPVFAALEKSWQPGGGRLTVCAKRCGEILSQYGAQFAVGNGVVAQAR